MAKKKGRADGRKVVTFVFEGKRYYAYGHTGKEAKEAAERRKQQLKEGKYRKASDLTFDEYYKRWEPSRYGKVKENTIRKQIYQYRAISGTEIDNNGRLFGTLKISEIERQNVLDLQRILSMKYCAEGTNGIIAFLYHILQDAYVERAIDWNPVKGVEPLQRTDPPARETTHRALNIEETTSFLEAAKDSWYYNLYRFLLASGCRCGEAGALRLTDISNGFVHINRTLTSNVLGTVMMGDSAKTKHSKRRIPYTDAMRDAVEDQRSMNRALWADESDLQKTIFRSEKGSLVRGQNVNKDIERICKKAGIKKFGGHAFRDTFATRALESGMRPNTLKEILGHGSFSMTMDLYAHTMDETKIIEMMAVRGVAK